MALKSTIFKAELSVADIDRGVYGDHALTLARHPSETDERMMVRLLAFALHAGEPGLAFGRGLGDPDEPDVVARDLTGAITHWIEVGQPDERAILKACGRSPRVSVFAYGSAVPVWWRALEPRVSRARGLAVRCVPPEAAQRLAGLAERSMRLHVTVQDGTVSVSSARGDVSLEPVTLRDDAAA